MHSISLNLFVKYVLRFRNYFARCIFISVYQCDRLKNYLPQRFHWQFRESNYLIAYYDSDRPHFKVTEIETRVNIVSSVKSVFKDLTQKLINLQYMQKPSNKEDLSQRENNGSLFFFCLIQWDILAN